MERVMFILYTTYIVKSEAIGPDDRKCSVFKSFPRVKIFPPYILLTGCQSEGRSSRLERRRHLSGSMSIIVIFIVPVCCPLGQAVAFIYPCFVSSPLNSLVLC